MYIMLLPVLSIYIKIKLKIMWFSKSEFEVNLKSIESIWEDVEDKWSSSFSFLFMLSSSLLFIRVWNAFWDRASPGTN